MRQAELPVLKAEAEAILRSMPIGRHVRSVGIEEGEDNEGGKFLRVFVRFDHLSAVNRDELRRAIDVIEDELLALDERFPSVRVSEAA